VLHIFFSKDSERRRAYENDSEWSEYLWLAERTLKRKITKKSPEYKRIKSTKLGMNYGLGVGKFSVMNSIPRGEAELLFAQVTAACPAIRRLQRMVAGEMSRRGFVRDPFGYIYHGEPRMAYKVVAYMIQGCAAALMKAAIISVDRLPVKILLTVHDELFFLTRSAKVARQVKEAMTDFSHLFDGIPIRVETSVSKTSWGEMEVVEL
jgi:DNA polymerase I-like protein with 3'-5' exonuclease and polymerase domains